MGVEGRPLAAGGAAALAKGNILAIDQRRKKSWVAWSCAECTGPKGRQGRFQWETEIENGGGPHEGMGRNQRIKKNRLFKWF
jgi:hypothetical protein